MAWLAVAPVKGLRLETVDAFELGHTGVRGDRRFYLVNDEGALINAKRAPRLLTVRAALDGGRLTLAFPDGQDVAAEVELGETVETSFYGRPVAGRLVRGPWNDALSALAGTALRLVRTEREGDGLDRGRGAGVSLVSTASLDALGAIAAYRGDVPTSEPLPFGVWCEVLEPGRVSVGDAVEPA